jgi:hypothetical protein
VVTWQDWLKIDEHERAAGEALGKPRIKLCSVEEQLAAAGLA